MNMLAAACMMSRLPTTAAIGYPLEIAFANTAMSGVTPTNS
ncbi:MAG TPA: hypothetical protein VK137_06820 [Planctomycetaceae bacterium]|nr:hypothetical protein [Planctomycetaceae bacterium]